MKFRLAIALLTASAFVVPVFAGVPSTPGPQNGNSGQTPTGLGRKKDKNPTDQNEPPTAPPEQAPTGGRRTPAQQQPAPPPEEEKPREDGDDRR